MPRIHRHHEEFETGSSSPRRLVRAIEGESLFDEFRAKVAAASSAEELERILDADELTGAQRTKLRQIFAEKEAREQAGPNERGARETQNQSNNLDEKIQRLRELGSDEKKKAEIVKKIKDDIDKEYVTDLEQMRTRVRQELVRVGIFANEKEVFESEKRTVLTQVSSDERIITRLIRRTQSDIAGQVKNLLDTNDRNQRALKSDIERSERRGGVAVEKLQKLLGDGEKRAAFKSFLFALEQHNIPPEGQEGTVDLNFRRQLKKWIALIENFGGSAANDVDVAKIFDAAATKEDLAKHFSLEPNLDAFIANMETVSGMLDTYAAAKAPHYRHIEKDCDNLSAQAQAALDIMQREGNTHAEINSEQVQQIIQNTAHIKEKAARPEASEQERKLAQSFLDANLPAIQNLIRELEEAPSTKSSAQTGEHEESESSLTDPEKDEVHTHHKGSLDKTMLQRAVGMMSKITTVNGAVTWYTFSNLKNEFKSFFDLIQKDYEDMQGDKEGGLKHQLAKAVNNRLGMQSQKNVADFFRGEADKRRKNFQHDSKEDILAQLDGDLATATRLGMILALANRGQLRASDRAVVEALCRAAGMPPPKAELWRQLRMQGHNDEAFWKIRDEFFMKALSEMAHDYYPFEEEAIHAQMEGYEKSKKHGTEAAGSNESSSAGVEFRRLWEAIQESGVEGDGKVVGMLMKLISRGNLPSGGKISAAYNIRINGAEKKRQGAIDMGVVGLMVVDQFLRGNINSESLADFDIKMEAIFPAFCVFRNMLIYQHGHADGAYQTKFEEWGWVEGGSVTPLGAREIINFFNTRNAKTKDDTIVHIATDATDYRTHSQRISTNYLRNPKGAEVGDKIAGYSVKQTDLSTIEQLFEGQTFQGSVETRTLISYIKSAVEEMADGMQMACTNERYYDRNTDSPIQSREEYERKYRANPDSVGRHGLERMQRGQRMLEIILKKTQNTSVLDKSPLYAIALSDTKSTGAMLLPDYIQQAIMQKTQQYRENPDFDDITESARSVNRALNELIYKRNNPSAVQAGARQQRQNTGAQNTARAA